MAKVEVNKRKQRLYMKNMRKCIQHHTKQCNRPRNHTKCITIRFHRANSVDVANAVVATATDTANRPNAVDSP